MEHGVYKNFDIVGILEFWDWNFGILKSKKHVSKKMFVAPMSHTKVVQGCNTLTVSWDLSCLFDSDTTFIVIYEIASYLYH